MIKLVEVENFEVLQGSYGCVEKNWVLGMNGAGKSSIGRAIFWCYTGRDIYGSQSTEHYIRDEGQPTVVRTWLDDGTVVERVQRGTLKTVSVDGESMTQEAFSQMIPVEWDIFASVFLVGFFMDLPEPRRRKIFMQITPQIDKSKVFSEMTSGLSAKDLGIDLAEPMESLHKLFNARVKSQAASIQKLIGKIEADTETYEGMESEAAPDPKALEEIENRIEVGQEKLDKWIAQKREFENFSFRNDQHQRWLKSKDIAATQNAERKTQMEELAKEKKAYLDYGLEVDEFRKEQLASVPKEVKEGDCLECGQRISKAYAKRVETARKEATVEIAKFHAKLAAKEDKLNTMHLRAQKLTRSIKPEVLLAAIPEVGAEVERPDDGVWGLLTTQLKELHQHKAEFMASAQSARMFAKKASSLKESVMNSQNSLKEEEANLTKLRTIMNALHPVRGLDKVVLEKKMENVQVPGVEFQLRKERKNGTIEECFKVKQGDIPFEYLSEGQKIKVSTKISVAIDRLSDRSVNVMYIPNSDLVDKLDMLEMPSGMQIFIEKVTEGQLQIDQIHEELSATARRANDTQLES